MIHRSILFRRPPLQCARSLRSVVPTAFPRALPPFLVLNRKCTAPPSAILRPPWLLIIILSRALNLLTITRSLLCCLFYCSDLFKGLIITLTVYQIATLIAVVDLDHQLLRPFSVIYSVDWRRGCWCGDPGSESVQQGIENRSTVSEINGETRTVHDTTKDRYDEMSLLRPGLHIKISSLIFVRLLTLLGCAMSGSHGIE